MGAGNTATLAVALAANVAAIGAVGSMWRRGRRQRGAIRSRHPSARPPLSVSTVEVGAGRRIRVDVPDRSPATAIDIVSFQQADSARGVWESEPLIEPIVINPGGWAILTTDLPADATQFNVVVAWTAHQLIGEVQGSHLFRIPQGRDERVLTGGRRPTLRMLPALALAALLTISLLLVAFELADSLGDDDVSRADTPAPTTEPQIVAAAVTTAGGTVSDPTTAASVSTAAPVPVTTSSSVTTSATTTGDPPDVSTTSTSVAASAPQVLASARVGECRFGSDCLIVDFTIEGFDIRPEEYICEFDDGSRYPFSFDSDGVETACSSSSADPGIVIEVDGVRSDRLTRADA